MRPLYCLMIICCFLAIRVFARNAPHNARLDMPVVHTFDTRESCMSRCRTGCTQQHSEDLMMPRWHCPLQEEDDTTMEEEENSGFGGKMLIVVPCVVFGSLLFLFFCVSAMQRLCRKIRRCRTGCTQQHSEDLMMPRWHCPLQEEDDTTVEDEGNSGFGGKMLIVVPCVVFGSLLFFSSAYQPCNDFVEVIIEN